VDVTDLLARLDRLTARCLMARSRFPRWARLYPEDSPQRVLNRYRLLWEQQSSALERQGLWSQPLLYDLAQGISALDVSTFHCVAVHTRCVILEHEIDKRRACCLEIELPTSSLSLGITHARTTAAFDVPGDYVSEYGPF
jgi:hypothetical protein